MDDPASNATDIFPNLAICGHDDREAVVAESVWMIVAAVVGITLALGGGGAGMVRRLRRARAYARAARETQCEPGARCTPHPSPPLSPSPPWGRGEGGRGEGGKSINSTRFQSTEV